jgi:hypothetical protein
MHRSVPRTHTSTSRGGCMGPRLRGCWTRVLKGGGARTHGLTKRTERVRTYLGITTRRVLGGYSRGTHGPMRGMIRSGAVERAVRGTRNGDAWDTSTRWGTANDTEYPTALGHCGGLLRAYSRPRAARARAWQCDGACGRVQGCSRTPTVRGARTQAHGAASRARRAHRTLSKLSADSAAGIVPSSEFE